MTSGVNQLGPVASTKNLRLVRARDRDDGTDQTPGMRREAGISRETTGSERLWMGYVTVAPGATSGIHHHGAAESGIYIISGKARFRSGSDLSQQFDASPGDFVFVPSWALHQELNLSDDEPVSAIVCRTISCDELVYNE